WRRVTSAEYVRSDRMNTRDFIANRVLPYSNQQFSTTFGGPIRKDRIHFFGNYEYEREPSTQTYTTVYQSFNRDLTDTRTDPKAGGRVDFQFSSQIRLMVRGNVSRLFTPYDSRYTGGGSPAPSSFHAAGPPHTNGSA